MEEEQKRREGSAHNRSPVGEGLRVLRLAEALKLSAETLDRIKAGIFGEAGLNIGRVEAKAEIQRSVQSSPEYVAPHAEARREYPSYYPKVERIDDAEIDRLIEAFGPKEIDDEPFPNHAPAQVRKPVEKVVPPAPPLAAKEASAAKAPLAPKAPLAAKAPVADVKAAAETAKKALVDESLDAEILLRQKIESAQNWAGFKAEAWRLYERFPRPDTAARMVELALMYGNPMDLEDVLMHLNRNSIEYFSLIPGQTRSHILIKLWQAKRVEFIDQFLFRKDLLLKLIPVERWYCAWSLIERGQTEQAFRWFKRSESEIWGAQKQFGSVMNKTDSEFAFVMGQSALRAEEETLALKLLESIPQAAPEFMKAIDLLLDLRVERDDKGYCAYGQKLSRELDWKARLGLLDSFLLRLQRVEHTAPKDRAALNALLVDPLRWFPETAEAWQLVSEMLLQFSGLERLLPNLLRTFTDRATSYLKPTFEHALWSPVLDHDFRDPIKTWYWRSIGMLHEFAWGLGQDEKKLWESRSLYQEAATHEGKALPYSWQQLHRGLTQWISKSDRLEDASRTRLLLMAKLCGETRDVSEEDVTSYLTQVQQPSGEVLETLESLARERQQWGLELFVHGRKASMFHHTNESLARVWELGAHLKRNDLCWRVATLLHVRQALNPTVERHWTICGEKRREFPVLSLNETHLKRILQNFEGYERRLVESLVVIGPLVPELLAGLNEHLVPLKKGKALTKVEGDVQESLDKMSWLVPSRKQFSPNPNGLWSTKPAFFANLIDTKWSILFVSLSQRLGITAWDWQLSLLNTQIETLIPKMSRSSESAGVGKVARWLRALSPHQRKAWYELAQLAKRLDDEKAQEVLARFLAILTTSIHQDHISALQSLDRMRAPLRLRWDLENWIASEAYGDVRKTLGTHPSGPFTEEIFRLPALNSIKS